MSQKRLAVPEARAALNNYKAEIAEELGINKEKLIDEGYLASYHTGQITKKLIEIAEKELVNKQKNSL